MKLELFIIHITNISKSIMTHKTTLEEFEEIKLKYNLAECTHFADILTSKFIKDTIISRINNDNNVSNNSNLKYNINNPRIFSFWIKFIDDTLIQYINIEYERSIKILFNDIMVVYTKNMENIPTKIFLTKIIHMHNFPINNIHLTNIIKNKIILLKYYFSIIPDIYKYILSIINNICINDPDICIELLFEQNIQYGYKI